MAVIGEVSERGSRSQTEAAVAAALSVASQLRAVGLGASAVVHGSASTMRYSFISGIDGSMIFAGDLDILIRPVLTAASIEQLTIHLNSVYRTSLGHFASPQSRVSLKMVTSAFLATDEAASLLFSATASGRLVDEYVKRPTVVRPSANDVQFPFAIPYALLRWIEWAGRSDAHNALALYELCKGLTRVSHQWLREDEFFAQTVIVERAIAFLIREELSIRRWMPPICARAIIAWLRTSGVVGAGPSDLIRNRCRDELRNRVVERWPRSLIAQRVNCTMRREAV